MNIFTKSIVLVLLCCAATASAQESMYKYQLNKPYTYIGEQKETMKQDTPNGSFNVSQEMNAAFQFTVLERTAEGNMKCKIDVKNAVAFAESSEGMETIGQDLANQAFTFTMDNTGGVTDVDSTNPKVKNESMGMMAQIMEFLPYLSPGSKQLGESWERNVNDTTDDGTDEVYLERQSTYKIVGEKEWNGKKCWDIKFNAVISINGMIVRANQDLSIIGERTAEGSILYIIDEGVLAEFNATTKSEQVVTSPSNPDTQVTVTSNETTKYELSVE